MITAPLDVVLRMAGPVLFGICLVVFVAGCASHHPAAWPQASELPSQPAPPDPLVRWDGTRVSTADEWNHSRRPELKKLFQHYMYGFLPPTPLRTRYESQGLYTDALGGRATLKLVRINTGDHGAPQIDLMLLVPNQRTGPVPVFLAMNFCGNHALMADARIPVTRGWVYESCKGCREGHATEEGRGGQASDWSVDQIISRGYALAAFCSSDIDPDRKDVSEGVYAWLANFWNEPAIAEPANRGSIAAWAWGFHRGVDYLVRDPDVNPRQIAVVGHSRNGKTALLAAALDERIALAIPHQAGCGGSAPSRGTVGESVKRINTAFPHWFNANFKQFNDAPDRIPFDQHSLVALCAPRPVLFSNATEDQWANPGGQFEMLRAADPVYKLLGVSGLESSTVPAVKTLSSGRLGYYIREGKHSMTSDDWRIFLDYADFHLRGTKAP